jgi:hypothetical protein
LRKAGNSGKQYRHDPNPSEGGQSVANHKIVL